MDLVPAEGSSTSGINFYHVFLSFRAKDTRKTFTDHLYTSLVQSGLRTFRNLDDDEEPERTEDLNSKFHRAIKRSRVSVIVFSENYASSRRCLDELVLILECKRRIGQFVLPVFCGVDPSEIRRQKAESMAELDDDDGGGVDGRMHEWRSALGELADLASEYGMVLEEYFDGPHEAEFIQKIIRVIEDKISRRILRVARYPVGIESRARNISLWLQHKATDVEILVICGMGGIGKTTIAKFVYNLNFRRFECSCFLANIREMCERPHGLVHLQNQLLSNILKGEKQKIWNVDEGITKIKNSLCCKRTLIVLDDVDEMYQLDALLGKPEFGAGSKIIITTRNKWFLRANDVHKVHTVERLDHDESLELFSWHAFGKNHPVEGYTELSERVICRCLGIPLALLVLGSSLSGRSPAVWTDALEKLEAITDTRIIQKLKVSFDCLQDDHDRNLFLHVACFFVGEDKDHVAKILDKCSFFSMVGIQNLIDRCLLNLEQGTKLMMHHLLQEMGREIVRRESPMKLGERSRLWHHEDSFTVLKEKNGTKRIQGLTLDMQMFNKVKSARSTFCSNDSRKRQCEIYYNESVQQTSSKRRQLSLFSWNWVQSHLIRPHEVDLETDAFTKLENLKLLRLNYARLTGCYYKFPETLRWLCWHGFHLKFLPSDLSLGNLVSLDLSYSNLEQVWRPMKQFLGSLKILNLSYSRALLKTPDFTGLPALEKLLLRGCIRLVGICESIEKATDLTLLDLEGCKNLRYLPHSLQKLRFLHTLIISGCSSLCEIPGNLRKMESMKVLRADGITIINPSLPSFAQRNKWWRPFDWSNPQRNPDVFWRSLPSTLVMLHLAASNLSEDSFPKDFGNLPLLRYLSLSENPIRSLPDFIRNLSELKTLDFTRCPKLQLLLDLPSSLEDLWVEDCQSLERVNSLSELALSKLMRGNCRKLVEIEGYFRLEPIAKVDQEIIYDMGLINVELLETLDLYLDDGYSFYYGRRPIQGLFEFGIFSTFVPSGVVPSWFSENKTTDSSVSFAVPLNSRTKCVNICCAYRATRSDDVYFPHPVFTKVHNKTKDLTWIYCPVFFGIPERDEELAWLSQWKFGNQLACGDEFTVSVILSSVFQVTECGVKLVSIVEEGDQVPEADMHEGKEEILEEDLDEIVGGDLSAFELTAGTYFLFRDQFQPMTGVDDWTTTEWFENLFGDSMDVIGQLTGSWDGN